MPTYEYNCSHCKTLFDFFQTFAEPVLAECPFCGKQPNRLISTPFFCHVKEVKDLMTLAESNSKRIGRDEIEEREEINREKVLKKKQEMASRVGGKIVKPSETRPFWRPDSDKPIDTSKISNIRNYIDEGIK